MPTLPRVLASTFFTITAQYRLYLPSFDGRLPETTTEPAAAVEDFACFAIVDFGALTEVNAHGDDGAFFDNHPFNHFRARADEAVIFDDGRVRLQRLQYATDADTAGQMICAQEPTVAQVSTMVPSST